MTSTANIDIEQLRQAAGQPCGLLKVLANPDRLLLLCQMTQGEYCVGALEEATGMALFALLEWRPRKAGGRLPERLSERLPRAARSNPTTEFSCRK